MVTKLLLDKEKASLQVRSSFNLQNQNKNLPLNTTEPNGAQIQQQHQRNLQSRKTLRDYQKKRSQSRTIEPVEIKLRDRIGSGRAYRTRGGR